MAGNELLGCKGAERIQGTVGACVSPCLGLVPTRFTGRAAADVLLGVTGQATARRQVYRLRWGDGVRWAFVECGRGGWAVGILRAFQTEVWAVSRLVKARVAREAADP